MTPSQLHRHSKGTWQARLEVSLKLLWRLLGEPLLLAAGTAALPTASDPVQHEHSILESHVSNCQLCCV